MVPILNKAKAGRAKILFPAKSHCAGMKYRFTAYDASIPHTQKMSIDREEIKRECERDDGGIED